MKLNCSFYVVQGGKKGKACGEGLVQWDSEREQVLQALVQLFQLDIRSLWSLSLVEEEFIRYSAVRRALAENTVSRFAGLIQLVGVIYNLSISLPSIRNSVALIGTLMTMMRDSSLIIYNI